MLAESCTSGYWQPPYIDPCHCPRTTRGPKGRINIRISHSGSKAHYKGDTRNHGLWDAYVYVVFWAPKDT